jgi:hypothetical protein
MQLWRIEERVLFFQLENDDRTIYKKKLLRSLARLYGLVLDERPMRQGRGGTVWFFFGLNSDYFRVEAKDLLERSSKFYQLDYIKNSLNCLITHKFPLV